MNTRLIFCGMFSGMLTAAVFTSAAYGADVAASAGSEAEKNNNPANATVSAPKETSLVERLKAASIAAPLREIVQMSDSGINTAVIQAYVENSSIAYQPNGDEIIYLHQHGIPSSIIGAMIQRGASLREQTAAAQANAAAQTDAQTAASASTSPAPPPAPSFAEVVSPASDYAAAPTYVSISPGYSYGAYPSCACVISAPYFYGRPCVAFGGCRHFSRPVCSAHGFRRCR